MKRAFFLDRDGTINIDHHYISKPELVEFFPRAIEAIKKANDAGWLVVVVTNQSGVGRGLIKPEELQAVHARMIEILKQNGAHIDHWQICIHAPSENCSCRKPKPKLILDLAAQVSIDLKNSVMIGDRLSDVACGKSAGCRSILVRTGVGLEEEQLLKQSLFPRDTVEEPDLIVADLQEAVSLVLDGQ